MPMLWVYVRSNSVLRHIWGKAKVQGRNHVFKVGVQSSVYGITTLQQKKNRQVYPVWCSLLHNHTLFNSSKSYVKCWGSVQIFGRSGPPPPVVAPMPRSEGNSSHTATLNRPCFQGESLHFGYVMSHESFSQIRFVLNQCIMWTTVAILSARFCEILDLVSSV